MTRGRVGRSRAEQDSTGGKRVDDRSGWLCHRARHTCGAALLATAGSVVETQPGALQCVLDAPLPDVSVAVILAACSFLSARFVPRFGEV